MSDVFDRLVARTTHRAPTLVARRPSRFEPAASTRSAAPPVPEPGLETEGDVQGAEVEPGELLVRRGEPRVAPAQRRARLATSVEGVPDDAPRTTAPTGRRRPSSASVPRDSAVLDDESGRVPEPDRQSPPRSASAAHRSETSSARANPSRIAMPEQSAPEPSSAGTPPIHTATGEVMVRSASTTGTETSSSDQRREAISRSTIRTPETRTISPGALLADHLAPALVESGALTEAEVARLVAVPMRDRGRPRHDGRTSVGIDPVEVPAAAEVHLHIDRLEVRRPPAPPPPAPATREPAGARPVDHTAYLDRQRRRGGTGRP
ncbi:hypothetical protein ACWEOW_19155 [Monashia sp. NPDC004114]